MSPAECLIALRPSAAQFQTLTTTVPAEFWRLPGQQKYVHMISLGAGAVYGLSAAATLGYRPDWVPARSPTDSERYIRSVGHTFALTDAIDDPRRELWRAGFYFNSAIIRLVTLSDVLAKSRISVPAHPALKAVVSDRARVIHEPPGTLPRKIGYQEMIDTLDTLTPPVIADFRRRLGRLQKTGKL